MTDAFPMPLRPDLVASARNAVAGAAEKFGVKLPKPVAAALALEVGGPEPIDANALTESVAAHFGKRTYAESLKAAIGRLVEVEVSRDLIADLAPRLVTYQARAIFEHREAVVAAFNEALAEDFAVLNENASKVPMSVRTQDANTIVGLAPDAFAAYGACSQAWARVEAVADALRPILAYENQTIDLGERFRGLQRQWGVNHIAALFSISDPALSRANAFAVLNGRVEVVFTTNPAEHEVPRWVAIGHAGGVFGLHAHAAATIETLALAMTPRPVSARDYELGDTLSTARTARELVAERGSALAARGSVPPIGVASKAAREGLVL